jgi:hypothetical protein
MRRLSLPCIHEGETQALEVTISMAHSHQATLVALALLPVVQRRWFPHQSRQTQDFFEGPVGKAEKPAASTATSRLQVDPASVSIASSLHPQQEAHYYTAQTDLWTQQPERIRGSTQ